MTSTDIATARKLLADRTDRTEIIGMGQRKPGDLALTAYWLGGGQRTFYELSDVEYWLEERQLADAARMS